MESTKPQLCRERNFRELQEKKRMANVKQS